MNFTHLLLGFDGRISRQPFWIGLLALAVIELAAYLAFGLPFIPEQMGDFSQRLTEFAIQMVTLYPTAAVMVKRLHDRNQSGYYSLVFVALLLVILLTNLLGLTGDPKNPIWLDWVLGFFTLGIGLAFLIELGLRRGTRGDNQFGPDPLDGRAAERGG